ncbi:MAG: hypothetical protein O7E52_02865 [Candidatus Poribacteria bacterium]|nr:hypothetical protein [Candidatus Poribacteria bacterium]
MKKAKHILIATLVILGVILLSNALVLLTLECVLSPEDIFWGHDTAERIMSETPVQRGASDTVQLPSQAAE